MHLIEYIKKKYSNYLRSNVGEIETTQFPQDEKRRYKIIFKGNVQGVGFRYEIYRIAEKLGITGFAENLSNGNVLVEAQGERNRLLYMIECMKKISRIYIEDVEIDEIEMKEEDRFTPVY